MAPSRDEDTQERQRRIYNDYYPSLAERVTILEQKQKAQGESFRNELTNMETSLKERIKELQKANYDLQQTAFELRMQVSELKIRNGIVATIAAIVTTVAFFILETFRQKLSGQ